MKSFYPFIVEKKKETFKQLPLYIELIPIILPKDSYKNDNDEDESESHIIEIDIF